MKKWMILNKSEIKNTEDVMGILLKNRGLRKRKEIEEFLHPSMDQLTFENVGIRKRELDKSIIRIKKAIADKESVIVYTDYDADGICAGAIVWETLYSLGAKAMPYVPHRMKEGYGLSKKGIDFLKKEFTTKLIITVDHGVSAQGKIDYAKKIGIDTIVLDHHLLPKKPLETTALVHTTKLCAGGIAWFFGKYLMTRLSSCKLNNRNLDLAALATIADIVPLLGSNRVIVKYGLEQLNKTERIGLNAIIEEAGLKRGEIGTYEVGHIIAPRINAMGRLTSALDSLRLICTKDNDRAFILAKKMSITNRERQVLTEEMTFHAMGLAKNDLSKNLLFIAHESYQQGIIGLVAGKLVEQFSRPAIVVSIGKEYSKASARSVNGFNIVEAIRKVSYLLEDVGGHPMAAGFTVSTKNLEKLKEKLLEITEKDLDEESLKQVVKIDLEIDFSKISQKLYEDIQKLSPFGVGNPQPVFTSLGVEVLNASLVGRNKDHLKLYLRQNKNICFQAIGFRMGEIYKKLSSFQRVDIAYTIEEDNWNNPRLLQLKLKDVKIAA